MKIGDNIEIVKYGHSLWSKELIPESDNIKLIASARNSKEHFYDINPKLVGKKGVIDNKIITQGKPSYSITFEDGSSISWFNEIQLKKL